MKEQVKVSPADVEKRVDAIFTAAIDRGLDAVAKKELDEIRRDMVELIENVNRNTAAITEAYADLRARVADLEAAVLQPELVLAEPLDGVVFESAAREPADTTRKRHMDRQPLRVVKGNQ
jgi:hypothetical protein